MLATITAHTEHSIPLEVTIELSSSMLESERSIQAALNEAGCLATGRALERFDTDGSPLVMGSSRWTSKGQEAKCTKHPMESRRCFAMSIRRLRAERPTARWKGMRG